MKNWFEENVIWTLKLYSITLVIPIAGSILNILMCGILGIGDDFLLNFKKLWIDYYFTGTILGVVAWRFQLGILFLCFIFNKLLKDGR